MKVFILLIQIQELGWDLLWGYNDLFISSSLRASGLDCAPGRRNLFDVTAGIC
jgi:hypothetical protein